ncbi:MAG: aldolase/citrate lyase family protein, partial [Pseudomonadota bacterium]
AGEPALGMNIRMGRGGEVVRVAKSSGHDFIFIDSQHSLFNRETVGNMAHIALGCGIAPMVRVRSVNDPDVALYLDNGVTGIIFPDVNTAADAQKGVDAAKFAPLGKRSVAGTYPHFDFRAMPLSQAIPAINDAALVVCMIETREGLDNVEKIAAVQGVDVIHVGSNDLLTNMGKPGQYDDPEIIAAQERVIAAARAYGKFAGIGGNRDIERQAQAVRKGCLFVTTQTDIGFLSAAATQWTKGVRAALAAKPA